MNVVIFGSKGFVGSAVTEELKSSGHEIYDGVNPDTGEVIDLMDIDAVECYLAEVHPDVVVNCAGIVSGEPTDFDKNVQFTHNILEGIHRAGLNVGKVLISGSAGEYGEVSKLPVDENTPLRGTSPYAQSKINEEHEALKLSSEYNVPVVVTRIFNPIGPNMKERFLIPGLIRQIKAIREGNKNSIEISRLDAKRDYVDVRDIAKAIRLIVEGSPKHNVYNVGSGSTMTNGQLLELLLKNSKLEESPKLIETSARPEPQFAIQADVTLLQDEFGWKPSKTVEDVIKETLDATEQ